MKKVLYSILVVGLTAFVACGPSAEEKAAQEKHAQDSLDAIEATRIADSTAAAQQAIQDSIAAAEKAVADSLAQVAIQDSIAKATKASAKPAPKPKTKAQKIEEKMIKEVKDATRGRG